MRALEQRSGRISALRGVTFLAAAGIAASRVFTPVPPWAWALAGLFLALFFGLIVAHAVLVTRSAALEIRVRIVERGQKRIAGEIAAFPDRGDRFLTPGHAYAGDLDIFGPASLFQLVSAAETGAGEKKLAEWLSAPASAAEIASRQDAVRELAGLRRFREELAFDGIEAGVKGRDAEPLLDWAEGRGKSGGAAPPLLSRSLAFAGLALAASTLAILIAREIFGAETLGPLRYLWALTLAGQVAILGLLRPATEPLLSIVSSREEPFGRYVALLRRIEGQAFTSPRLAALRSRLGGDSGADASAAVGSLQRIVGFADLRHNALLAVLANGFLLWDVVCAIFLSRWRERAGTRIRAWLEITAEMEALASLGSFADEHPAFAFPDVDDGEPHFEADALGHPLLPEGRRVSNDVVLGGAGSALMITGSNMSGKSTLLRSIGTSSVLALAGAPVCATRLRMASAQIRTSMRIKDSLEEGVSHFYAELGRLKTVVDAVDGGEKVVFLLDEILHGTNSRERQIGAKAVVRHLLAKGAVGAVSSHDLGLADLEAESAGKVKNVHFEELVADGKMTFDYLLKPGVVTTTNALRLMKLIGIKVALPGTE